MQWGNMRGAVDPQNIVKEAVGILGHTVRGCATLCFLSPEVRAKSVFRQVKVSISQVLARQSTSLSDVI